MAQEIERKFLVRGDFKKFSHKHAQIKQGYLSTVAEITVRVRVKGEKGYLTIKGAPSPSGASRYEWEKEIPADEANELLKLCDPYIIDKTRYNILFEGFLFEVDEFHGENKGLVLAEIELNSEDEVFSRPDWLGEEVTGDIRYYNSYLSRKPFKSW